MKFIAFVAAVTALASIAYSGGTGSGIHEGRTLPQDARSVGDDAPAALPSSTPCDPPLTQSWFAAICRPITGCAASQQTTTFAYQPLASADVNDDGVMDYFTFFDSRVVFEGAPFPGCLLIKSDMVAEGDSYSESLVCVGDRAPVTTAVLQRFPTARDAYVWQVGWRDIDGDGDLDLTLNVRVDLAIEVVYFQCWLENIGYEKPSPPLAADLNRDGYVDGVDLGMLLASWGAQS